MTRNSSRKKDIRARQAQTGEAYNAAARALNRGLAGLTLDSLLANYVQDITGHVIESGIAVDAHEWTGSDTDDGPGAFWIFQADNPSAAQQWPDGVSIIWSPLRAGWIDHTGVPLPLDDIADILYAVRAIREHVLGHPQTTSVDGPRWPLADELEDLIVADLADDS